MTRTHKANKPQRHVPEAVVALVERFRRNRDSYRGPGYNETQARREFIDPLFYELYGLTDDEIRIVEEATGL